MTDGDRDRIAHAYRAFAGEAGEESPRYAALSAAVAEDGEVLGFLAGLPSGRRRPTLFFAALRFVDGVPADGTDLRRRVSRHADALRETMLTRSTQTNEPARCTGLLPPLGLLDGPLALVEVGASAGLCLYPDRYSYSYDGRQVGPPSPVHLHCTTSGPVPVPSGPPEVVARIGVDLNPLDVTDPADLAWLRALVWPGTVEEERLARLGAAAALAAQEPPTLLAGDLVDRLPDALADLVRSLAVRWLAQEGAGMVPGTGQPFPDGWGPYLVVSLGGCPLAHSAAHGGHLEWLAGSS